MEFINGSFTVYSKTNGQSLGRITDVKFWADAGLNVSGYPAVSDPRVIFDPATQRWFASQVDANATASDPTLYANDFLFAVSSTPDPRGAWQAFSFRADPDHGYFADFPTLGLDSNAVYLAGDYFYGASNAVGPGLVSIPKADLVGATPTVANRTWFGVMDYSVRGQVLQPAACFDGSSSGSVLAMGDIGTDSDPHSNMVSFAVLNAASHSATLSAPVSISIPPYEVPYNSDMGAPLFNPMQPDGTTTLQANDARLSAHVYAVNGVLYAVHNTELNGRIAIRWYRINAATAAVLEAGTISDPALDLFFPSIAANANGTVIIAYNGSSENVYVSCYAVAGQTVNGVTTFGSPLLLQSGLVSYHDYNEVFSQLLGGPVTDSRWGDYSTVSVDPIDQSRFWMINMYPSGQDSSGTFGIWSTQITQLLTSSSYNPVVSLAQFGAQGLISWPATAANFTLQSNTNLSSSNNWMPVTGNFTTNNGQISVQVALTNGAQFFRLHQL